MFGEASKDDVKAVSVGDVIDVKIDFTANRIYYYNNEELQGFLTPQKKLVEGTIYPSANLAQGTKLVFRNEEDYDSLLDPNRKWKRLLAEFPSK